MARLRVAPIVEGDGEVECVRPLLERLWSEELNGDYIDVLRPVLKPKSTLLREDGLRKAVGIALEKLRGDSPMTPADSGSVLILVDADDDCPAELGPRLLGWAREADPRADVACVIANVEYETWSVASAGSLVAGGHLRLKPGESIPADPEALRLREKWIEDRFVPRGQRVQQGRGPSAKGGPYSSTRDQAALTRAMDLKLCRRVSPSFAKLYRELEKRRSPEGREAV